MFDIASEDLDSTALAVVEAEARGAASLARSFSSPAPSPCTEQPHSEHDFAEAAACSEADLVSDEDELPLEEDGGALPGDEMKLTSFFK